MRKLTTILFVLALSLFLNSLCWAMPIMYEITSATDPYGNALSGFVNIEETVSILGSSTDIYGLQYEVTGFELASDAISFSGNDGNLRFPVWESEVIIGMAFAIFHGSDDSFWHNDGTGIIFSNNDDPPNSLPTSIEYYSVLPDYIAICATDVWWGTEFTSLPSNTITLSKSATAPVPEPATLMLVGTGLICLAGFGRKKLTS